MAGEAANPQTTTPAAAAAPVAPVAAPSVLGAAMAAPAAAAPAAATTPTASATPAAAVAPTPATAAGEIKLTAPKDSGLADADVAKVAEFAKANGLTQAQAEKILERDAQGIAGQAAAKKQADAEQAQQQFAVAEKVKADGAKMFAADPDFGGPKLKQSVEMATRVIAKYADLELRQFLAQHPLGSDPLVLRMLARIGAAHLSEDATIGGTSTKPGAQQGSGFGGMLDRWYPPPKSP